MPLRLVQIIIAVMFAASPINAGAQVTIPMGGGGESAAKIELTSPEAVREIISRMSDAEVRGVLLERLDAVAAEAANREAATRAVTSKGFPIFEGCQVAPAKVLPLTRHSQALSDWRRWRHPISRPRPAAREAARQAASSCPQTAPRRPPAPPRRHSGRGLGRDRAF